MIKKSFAQLQIGRLAIHVASFDEAADWIIGVCAEKRAAYVVTPNVDHIVRAEKDDEFVRIATAADLVVADGMPLIWASHLLNKKLPERIAGSDLMPALCERAARAGLRIYLLGGMPGDGDKAAAHLRQLAPALQIAGMYSPPFGFELDDGECRRIVEEINAARADLVFVGVGSPKQERWIARWRSQINCGALLGVGISIAFLAGSVKRAPVWMQRSGTEWLYRLLQEPRRLAGRYLKDASFLFIVWRSRQMMKKHGVKNS